MALFNYSTKELTAKVVYYGPGLCGKTTNLQWIHEKLPIRNKGKMLSLATETDRTLFFDFLPIELGAIRGMKVRVQLYTVPGQVFYNATRRMVLKGADCIVFVCDSQEPVLEANAESLENLRDNLLANEIDPDSLPMVLQYNKRDLPNALPIEILNERLNPKGHAHIEAVAIKGVGVEETLKAVTGLVFRSLASRYGDGATGRETTPTGSRPKMALPQETAPSRKSPLPPVPPPEPKPVAAPARPATPVPAPEPPAPAEPADDLLDSLELEPAALSEDLEFDLGDEASSSATPPAQTAIETVELSELELAPEAGVAPEVDVQLELESDEELHLDVGPVPPPVAPARREPVAAPAVARPEPVVARAEPVAEPAGPAVAARPGSTTLPVAGRGTRPAVPAETTAPALHAAPLVVEVPGEGRTEVAIPVELRLEGGQATVNIHLRLSLDVKFQR